MYPHVWNVQFCLLASYFEASLWKLVETLPRDTTSIVEGKRELTVTVMCAFPHDMKEFIKNDENKKIATTVQNM